MAECALRFGVESDNHRIFGRAITPEWLPNVILAVANAAASSTGLLLDAPLGINSDDDLDLRESVYATLTEAFTVNRVHRKVARRGRSGKKFNFAFSVALGDYVSLVDVVTPNSISISSRYTAFSAVEARREGGAYIAHKLPLANEDTALLAEVADVVPLSVLPAHIERDSIARARFLS